MISYFPVVTGSLVVLGNVSVSGSINTSGSITISGSITSASFASTASFVALAQSASNAVSAATASFANTLTVAGNLTAQTLVVQTITSSVDFVTGSTRFGSLLANTHVFSGSVTMNPNGLFVSSSGIVGIGTTSPNEVFEVFSPEVAGTSQQTRIRITQAASVSSRVNLVAGVISGSNPYFAIEARQALTPFAIVERLRIDGNGNVGIGTSSPSSLLDVRGTATYDFISISNGSTSGGGGILTRQNATASSWFGNSGGWEGGTSNDTGIGSYAGGIRFYTNGGTEKMRITSGGHVGIKITPNASWGSAMAALQIGTGGVLSNWTGANSNFTVGVNYYDNGAGSQLRLYAGATSNIGFNEDTITFNSAASSTAGSTITFVERMRISGGNVRIVNVGSLLQFDTDGSGASTTLGTNGQYDFRIYNGRGGASNLDVSTYEIVFGMNGSTNRYRMGSGAFYPAGDNAYTCGASGQRWSAIWAANGTIQTSDARQKKDITDSDLGLEFINKLRPVSYKWKVGKNVVTVDGERIDENGATQSNDIITPVEGTRTHYGLIAQEVKEALGDIDFGGYIYDEETDTLALRYDQFISPLIKSIQELKAEFDEYKATHP